MEQFSIERWKELGGGPEVVKTRDGRKVQAIHVFEVEGLLEPVTAIIEKHHYWYSKKGMWNRREQCGLDLMLEVPEVIKKIYYGVHDRGLLGCSSIKGEAMSAMKSGISKERQMGILVIERNLTTGKAKAWIEE